MEHDVIPAGEIHTPFNWLPADASARLAIVPLSSDVNKLALQLDDHSQWVLTDDSPPTWQEYGEQGPEGPQGDPGPTGPTGAMGPQGPSDQWIVYGAAPTYISATSFSVVGDQTQIFQVGRRIKTTNTGGTIYSTITGSVYGAPNTTVTVSNDSGVLDAGLSAVSYGIISGANTSLPGGIPAYGQCRLTKSGVNLLLTPYLGNKITINGSICTIPSAGVSLAPTGATVSTLYYIYAYMVGAVMTLEYSTTGHSTDTATGVEIKTGDATRTLVGMARPIAGPLWQDAVNQRFVISWFNQRPIKTEAPLGTTTTTISATYAEVGTSLRNEFLCWAGASLPFNAVGAVFNNVANFGVFSALSLDGALNALEGYNQFQSYQANAYGGMSVGSSVQPSEGYHYVTLVGATSGGNIASWVGSSTVGTRTVVNGLIYG